MKVSEAYAYAQTPEGLKAAKAFMDRPRLLENRLTLLYARMDALRDKMYPGGSLDGMPRASGHGDKTGRIASKMCELEEETEKTLHALALARERRKRLLQDLPEGESRQALTLLYLENLSSLAAADRMYLEQRQFFRHVNRGLVHVAMRLAMDPTCADGEKMV